MALAVNELTRPGDARVAVSIVVNVEEGAELSIACGDERNEGTYEAKQNAAVIGARSQASEASSGARW